MKPADIVTYLARPSWGPGLVKSVLPNGWLEVEFHLDGDYFTSELHPQEVQLAVSVKATEAAI